VAFIQIPLDTGLGGRKQPSKSGEWALMRYRQLVTVLHNIRRTKLT